MARVDAVLRRCPQRPKAIASIGFANGEVDFERQEVRLCGGNRVELSEKENELLLYLARHAGRAISRDELLSSVWGLAPQGISTRTIDMHIARLREKLRGQQNECDCLLTVRGKGYMWATTGADNRCERMIASKRRLRVERRCCKSGSVLRCIEWICC